jgi:hypothetical protein
MGPGGKADHFIWCRGQEWWSYTSTPPYVFMTWCLLIKNRDNFISLWVYSVDLTEEDDAGKTGY